MAAGMQSGRVRAQGRFSGACSYLALLGLAQQAFGLEDDYHQEQHEGDAFLVCGGYVRAHQVLEYADENTAEQRATRLVEAADDRCVEGLEADRLTHVEFRQIRWRDQ